jgi:transposase-like protein
MAATKTYCAHCKSAETTLMIETLRVAMYFCFECGRRFEVRRGLEVGLGGVPPDEDIPPRSDTN